MFLYMSSTCSFPMSSFCFLLLFPSLERALISSSTCCNSSRFKLSWFAPTMMNDYVQISGGLWSHNTKAYTSSAQNDGCCCRCTFEDNSDFHPCLGRNFDNWWDAHVAPMRCFISSGVVFVVMLTISWILSRNQLSQQVKFGDFGVQVYWPPLPIHRPGNWSFEIVQESRK